MTTNNAWLTGIRKARAAVRRLLSAELRATSLQLNQPVPDGFFDYVNVDPAGIISIHGWSTVAFDVQNAPSIAVDGTTIPLLRHFRTPRQDVVSSSKRIVQSGLELNYLVPESIIGRHCKVLTLQLPSHDPLQFELNSTFLNPHYRSLLYSAEVLHREHIYCSGPPNQVIHPNILEFARQLDGPVLDFGCGRGALIEELLKRDVEAYGVEVDSPVIRKSIPEKLSGLIRLYDGVLPSAFSDGQFRSVVCSEVLEHIRDYQLAIKELARLASETVLITVPDASAIPLGFRHGSVPWHLMESTHVNFFNQESLEVALKPYFSGIEFSRVGAARFNDSSYHVSLLALCRK